MSFTKALFEIRDGQRRLKPQVVMLASISSFLLFFVLVLLAYKQNTNGQSQDGPLIVRPAVPQRNLDYNIVKLDTIPYGSHLKSMEQPQARSSTGETAKQQPERVEQKAPPSRRPAQVQTTQRSSGRRAASPVPSSSQINRNPNMIVHASPNVNSGTPAAPGRFGFHSVLVKVMLPDQTPVTNNSIIDARVINNATWAGLEIPRRSQLLGRARIQNNRIQINFNQLRIGDITYTCNGQAYDLKRLPGLPFTPLDDRTRQIVIEELRDAASGLPVVGEYARQQELNPFNQEITNLDEGLEFYAEISNIFR